MSFSKILYKIKMTKFICLIRSSFLTAHSETLSSGQEIDVSAAVGLLSHNIRIVGEDYSKLYKESFGARVLIGLVTSRGQTYTGDFSVTY